jgi:hypothetical protein
VIRRLVKMEEFVPTKGTCSRVSAQALIKERLAKVRLYMTTFIQLARLFVMIALPGLMCIIYLTIGGSMCAFYSKSFLSIV